MPKVGELIERAMNALHGLVNNDANSTATHNFSTWEDFEAQFKKEEVAMSGPIFDHQSVLRNELVNSDFRAIHVIFGLIQNYARLSLHYAEVYARQSLEYRKNFVEITNDFLEHIGETADDSATIGELTRSSELAEKLENARSEWKKNERASTDIRFIKSLKYFALTGKLLEGMQNILCDYSKESYNNSVETDSRYKSIMEEINRCKRRTSSFVEDAREFLLWPLCSDEKTQGDLQRWLNNQKKELASSEQHKNRNGEKMAEFDDLQESFSRAVDGVLSLRRELDVKRTDARYDSYIVNVFRSYTPLPSIERLDGDASRVRSGEGEADLEASREESTSRERGRTRGGEGENSTSESGGAE